MIIAIHVNLFWDSNDSLNVFIVDILCRFAVPFFAVCSGYFLKGVYESSSKVDGSEAGLLSLRKYGKKIIKLYLIWSVIYLLFSLPEWVETGWFSTRAFLDYGIASIRFGSYYHLWYLLSLIYAIFLLLVIIKYFSDKEKTWLIILLWTVKTISYGYQMVLPDGVRQQLSRLMFWRGMYDAVFCILPLLLLGAEIYKKERKKTLWIVIGFCVSFILLIIEVTTLKHLGQDEVSFIFTTLPTSYFLFQIVLSIKIKSLIKPIYIIVRQSTFIYCFHPIAIKLYSNWVTNSFSKWIVVAISSTIAGIGWYSIRHVRQEKR